jgi:hypothetical protein
MTVFVNANAQQGHALHDFFMRNGFKGLPYKKWPVLCQGIQPLKKKNLSRLRRGLFNLST